MNFLCFPDFLKCLSKFLEMEEWLEETMTLIIIAIAFGTSLVYNQLYLTIVLMKLMISLSPHWCPDQLLFFGMRVTIILCSSRNFSFISEFNSSGASCIYYFLIFHIEVYIFNPSVFSLCCFHRHRDLLFPCSARNRILITLKNFMQVSNMFSFI